MDNLNHFESLPLNEKFDLTQLVQAYFGSASRLSFRLIETTLNRPYLVNHKLDHFNIIRSILSAFNAMGSSLLNGHIIETQFLDSDFNCCTFKNVFFRDVEFLNCSLRNTVFDECIFEGCQFQLSPSVSAEDSVCIENSLLINTDTTTQGSMNLSGFEVKGCTFLGGEPPAQIQEKGENIIVSQKQEPEKPPEKDNSPQPKPPSPPDNEAKGGDSRFEKLEF